MSTKFNTEERGKLQRMILKEILPDISQAGLIEALCESWGVEKAREFAVAFEIHHWFNSHNNVTASGPTKPPPALEVEPSTIKIV